jgi:hypothetical protein
MATDGLFPLTDDEKVGLTALLKRTIDADHYPLSPRIGKPDDRTELRFGRLIMTVNALLFLAPHLWPPHP